MKTILMTIAVLLVWTASLNAAELKVKVPVKEFEQMQTRLADMENENSRLKQEVRSLERSSSSSSSTTTSQPSEELKSRVSDLEHENRQLKQQVTSRENSNMVSQPAPDSTEIQTRLTDLENKNRRLRNQVKNLKAGGIAATLAEDRRSTKQFYAIETKRNFKHPFKF